MKPNKALTGFGLLRYAAPELIRYADKKIRSGGSDSGIGGVTLRTYDGLCEEANVEVFHQVRL